MRPEIVVLDTSVGVKWFRSEAGSDEAMDLLKAHGEGRVGLVVVGLFTYELMGVGVRHLGAVGARRLWEGLAHQRLRIVGLDDALAEAALEQVDRLGCRFFDAVPAGLADRLGVTLVSADGKAHGSFPGVRLIGEP